MRYFCEQALQSKVDITDKVIEATNEVYVNDKFVINVALKIFNEYTLEEIRDNYLMNEKANETLVDIISFMICKAFEKKQCLITELGIL